MTTVIRGSLGLKTITFPKTVRKIRMGAFYHVKSLQGAVVNSRIQCLTWKMRYKSEAQDEVKGIFQDTGLKCIRLPRRLKEIGEFTFKNCSKLLKTHFPASLREIGRGAFENSGITHFNAPQRLSQLGPNAFCGCESLEHVQINENMTVIEVGCFKCTNIS